LMALVMAMNAVLIALAPEAMTIMASREYHDAIWIIPPVACSAYLLFVSQQFINIEFFYEENKFAAYSSIGIAALNLGLNYIFVDAFGYIAAGYTTLFCYLVFTAAHYIAMKRVCRKHLGGANIWHAKYILLMTIGFLSFSGLMLLCYNGFIVRYAVVLIIMIIAVIKRKSIMALLKKRK
ncbi:polysaccharide biosynthesis C-terminal domain-containing protein, partial [Butyricicoccus sp.]|uniref:polysaccharide biosynthesis C-terminal domain-containing protein n=1 Tax=Butyricicoccus sp. TaxID=2049021 RepID=UPI003735AEED